VEHNSDWYGLIANNLPHNATLNILPLGDSYWNAVLQYRPDFVVIDGRHRKRCAWATASLKPDAVLWDDAQREYYQCCMGLFDEYERKDFVCDVAAPKMARLFIRRDGKFKDWI
jgi:hypothetical protein